MKYIIIDENNNKFESDSHNAKKHCENLKCRSVVVFDKNGKFVSKATRASYGDIFSRGVKKQFRFNPHNARLEWDEHFIVRADTERFGKQAIMFEGISWLECYDYMERELGVVL